MRSSMLLTVVLLVAGCSRQSATDEPSPSRQDVVSPSAAAVSPPAFAPIVPVVEYHAHLLSPVTAKMAAVPLLPAIDIPAPLTQVLGALGAAFKNKPAALDLLAKDAMLLNLDNGDLPSWVLGRDGVADVMTSRFARAYRVTPVAYRMEGSSAQIAGYFTRGEGATLKHFGHVFVSLTKAKDGAWRIAVINPSFPGPHVRDPITADQIVSSLDDAGIKRAVVLSVAYWFGSAFEPPPENEYEKVRAENDWVAAEAARFPDRLIPFCSFSPLRDYALAELDRCSKNPLFRGVKLHLGNSGVDLRKPEHLARVRSVFSAANEHHLALVVHMWTDPDYEVEGRQYAEVFLNQLLPAAPDVPIQIAHMAGGGRSTDSALAVFANAITEGDRRTRNLYFDVATLTAGQTPAGLRQDALRMRQIGLDRILFGTDMWPPNPQPRVSWATFRTLMPLTDQEFRIIASNVAPYAR